MPRGELLKIFLQKLDLGPFANRNAYQTNNVMDDISCRYNSLLTNRKKIQQCQTFLEIARPLEWNRNPLLEKTLGKQKFNLVVLDLDSILLSKT